MKLPIGQEKKRNQALDAVASVAKTWSEWRLGERVSKTVSMRTKSKKGSGRAKSSPVAKAVTGTPLKIAGLVAFVGGLGAAIAKKLKGSGPAEPVYTPPPPPPPPPVLSEPPSPPAPAAPPEPLVTAVVVEDLVPLEDVAPAAADVPDGGEQSAESEAAADEPEAAADADADADASPQADAPDASELEADDEKTEKSAS
jgi:hypothetical protein